VNAVEDTFGVNVDHSMLAKVYGGDEPNGERCSPSEFIDGVPRVVTGHPKSQRISTSHILNDKTSGYGFLGNPKLGKQILHRPRQF
jgi:hypothetical protein